jgi:hypothetical protein
MARLLPPSVHGWLRDGVTWLGRHRQAPAIEDWSRPLIATASGAAGPFQPFGAVTGPQVTGPPGPDNAAAAGGHDRTVLRCLVVTSRLDTGGLPEVAAIPGPPAACLWTDRQRC